jgi:hypothetical protein
MDEREPFDGRVDRLPVRTPRRYRHEGHGPRCSSNPEIGCVCRTECDETDAPMAERDENGRIR